MYIVLVANTELIYIIHNLQNETKQGTYAYEDAVQFALLLLAKWRSNALYVLCARRS